MTETALSTHETHHLQITFQAPDGVRQSLAALGRTEDVRFSPSGRRLAFACYRRGVIAVADVEIAEGPEVVITRLAAYPSPHLRQPHGLDFVDEDTVIVASRGGGLATFGLPPSGADGELTLVGLVDDERTVRAGPGSVAVRPLDSGGHEALVCNNWADTLTSHPLDESGAPSPGNVVLRAWLDLPDGLAISGDGRWLAVSNHDGYNVLLFECAALHEDADPAGILRGVHCPHGLRFGADDRSLLVADAATPYVHVFTAPSSDWHGVRYPSSALRVMDDETFARGRTSPQEGGPKGIDVDPRTSVLAVTAENAPLAFFDLERGLEEDLAAVADAHLRYELHVLEESDRLKADAAMARAQLVELQQTKAWRLLQPPRRVYAALRRRARRGP